MFLALFALAQSVTVPPAPEPLAYFSGEWRCEGHFTPSNRPLSSTMTFSVDPATKATLKAHRDLPPATYVANETWSAARAGGFRLTIADGFAGQRWYTSSGWREDRWVWERQRAGGEPQEQFIYMRRDADHMTVEWWIARGDQPMAMGDTLACVRQT